MKLFRISFAWKLLLAAVVLLAPAAQAQQTLNWVFVSATGIPRPASTTRPLYIYLTAPGDIYIDDVSVVAGSTTNGVNVLNNGGFETGVLSPWVIGSTGNNSASAASTNFAHSGSRSLHLVAATGGTTQNSSIWQDMSQLTVGATYTLSYWYRQTTNANGGSLIVRFSNDGISTTVNPVAPPYTNLPPAVLFRNPPDGSVTRTLTQVEVIFSKPVQGVDAADLLINGSPATSMTAINTSRYLFTFPQPPTGTVSFDWAPNHGIADLADAAGAFTGGSWTGTLNPAQPSAGVVINEIHYHPIPKTDHVEFIELYNDSEQTNDISNWQFSSGISFTFPPGTLMPPDSYLVLTENKVAFDAKFGEASLPYPVTAFGEWTGSLANEGERIRLVNTASQIISEVTYGVQFPWPIGSDDSGSSMERINPWVDGHLPGSWRSSLDGAPTPGRASSVFVANAPPDVETVAHTPKAPTAGQEIAITTKVQDPDGVGAVTLQYQVVSPGNYIPAYLAKTASVLLAHPNDPLQPNPVYLTNWISVPMTDNGTGGDVLAGDSIYTAIIPGNTNRTLIRYRIVVADTLGASVRVPYADDPSLNFACFIYNGVPDYVAANSPVFGAPHIYPAAVISSVPVYQLLTASNDFSQCVGYNAADQINKNNFDARDAYNWTATFVYDGEVYDNIGYRLGRRNARYASYVSGAVGKRNFKFKFNQGRFPYLRDMDGNLYSQPTKTLASHNMVGSRSNPYWGLDQTANDLMWNLAGVPAPNTHWFHLRVIQGAEEESADANGQYFGDFYGLLLATEDYDSNFIAERDLEKGNIYKLVSFETATNAPATQKYQSRDAVSDASDIYNILYYLRPEQSDDWLREYVNYNEWYHYKAIAEAIRHYDMQPNLGEHLKNREYYFQPSTNVLGQVWTLPQDSDSTWGPSFNGGVDFEKQAIYGYNGATPRTEFIREYMNVIREVRDLLWTPEQVTLVLDPLTAQIGPFVDADRDRWTGAPVAAGSQNNPPIATVVADMKKFAFTGGSWTGGNDSQIQDPAAKDSGISGQQGRGAYLDTLTADALLPATPLVTATGPTNYPLNLLTFAVSNYSGANAFAAWQWRIAEVTLTNELPLPPGAHPKFEIVANWESDEINDVTNRTVTIPSVTLQAGHTYRVRARAKDTTGRWSHWSAPVQFVTSKGAVQISINEWMADNKHTITNPFNGAFDDWFELYNFGDSAFDLGGYFLTGTLSNPTKFQIPNNHHYLIPPHGFFLVWADNNSGQNSTNRPELHVNFALGKSGDSIGLFAPDGTAIDSLTFGTETTDISHGRFPDGSTNLFFMPTPTPQANNVIPNHAPSLNVVSNRFVHLGQTLHFTATATDADSWYQTLAFSLTNSPAGAGIDPTTGAFTWAITNVVAPSTNSVTVRVTDNGVPPLSDSRTFLVTVQPPPQFTGTIAAGGNGLQITFSTLPGQNYQVEYKENLSDPGWTPLGAPVAGDGNPATILDNLTAQPQRFYRVVVSN